MISVLMPIYNAEEYIGSAIESVLNQTYNDFELIAINDGSTDNTLQILKRYENQDSRIKLITRENMGLNYTLNEGLSYCTRGYIARMDADDISFGARFERQLSYMMDNPDIDILGTYIDVIGAYTEEKKTEMLLRYNQPIDQVHMEFHLLSIGFPSHPTWIMKKDAAMSIGGYGGSYRASEDYDFIMRACKAGMKIDILPEVLLYYRRYDSSKSAQQSRRYEGIMDAINIKIDYLTDMMNFNKRKIAYWGAGAGGSICKQLLEARFPGITSICFFDRYKTGKAEGLDILPMERMDWQTFDYIIGASTPGRYDILEYMKTHHKKYISDYIILV